VITILATDILLVTQVGLKVDAEVILTGDSSTELVKVSQGLESFGADAKKTGIVEYDWAKIKDLEFQEMLRTKSGLMKRLKSEFQCTRCPDLNEHVSKMI
jgi:antiviral helicase SKI2